MKLKIFACAMLILSAVIDPLASKNSKDEIRRFALVVGANNGGKDRTELRYAVSDASSFIKVMYKMGGVMPGDGMIIIEPKRNDFLTAINKFNEKLDSAKKHSGRIEFIFYYSGHSDEEGILLSGEKMYYKEIKQYINNVPAEVKIAILDSCSSGAFARLKGGKKHAPFLIDSSYNMKGYAFMTSSSSDEASQESDKIKGSFFTHYLVSGLRGAADLSQDGRITLSEAYQFAYNETLTGTEKTISGPQHPNYNIQMAGVGDVVMTDIKQSSSIMVISKDISGRLSIRDRDDNLIVELKKSPGRDIQIGLEDGDYTILNERDGALYEAKINISLGSQLLLSQSEFKKTDKQITVARGEKEANETGEYKVRVWNFSVFPDFENDKNTIFYYLFNLFGSYSAKLDGFSLGLGPTITREKSRGLMLSAAGNYTSGEMEGAAFSDIFNYSGKSLTGAQFASIFNMCRENTTGIQAAGLFNYNNKKIKGAQLAGLFNYAGQDMDGGQIAGLFNYSGGKTQRTQISGLFNYSDKDTKAAQIAGLFSFSKESVKGAQISGLFGYSGGGTKGAQISGIYNHSGKDMTGVQIAGLCNYTGDAAEGLQTSGIFNYTGKNMTGVQIAGILNKSGDFNGMQIGLVNIAKQQNGIPIGLVNISDNGSIDFLAWGSNLMAYNTGVRFRANHIYTIFSAGYNNIDSNIDKSLAGSFYLGVDIPVISPANINIDSDIPAISVIGICIDAGSMFIDNDRIFSNDKNPNQQVLQGRAIAYFNISNRFSVFGGGGVSYIYDADKDAKFSDGKFEPLYLGGVQLSFYNR